MSQLKIFLDGTVFAMAQVNPAARTGIYFLLRDLAEALNDRPDVSLSIFAAPAYRTLLQEALKSGPLSTCVLAGQQARLGFEKIFLIATFYPFEPSMYRIQNASVFQIIHDLSFHACQLKGDGFDFETNLVASLGSQGRALCISDNTRRDLIKYFDFPKERTAVFYPSVREDIRTRARDAHLSVSQAKRSIGLTDGSQYIIALSTLEPRKNLPTSLKAFQAVCESLGNAELYFVVTGLPASEEHLAGLTAIPEAIRKRIIFTGYVRDDALPALLSGAVCLVYPSLYEGFGMPPLEAMTCGTPVIASNAGSLPEVIGDAGKIVDVMDYAAIANIIHDWLMNPAERERWSAKGREHAKSFTREKSAAAVVEALRQAP
jgi:glycosyltransferase involved in cell wall biosynthesis